MPISTYTTPGIYIQEVPGAHNIQAVGTSTAAFVGVAPDAGALVGEVQAINNWSQFVQKYAPGEKPTGTDLSTALYGFFENGGGLCFVVNIGDAPAIGDALDKLRTYDEINILVAPGRTDPATHAAMISHCANAKDRVAILDLRPDATIEQLTEVAVAEKPSSSSRRSAKADDRGPKEGAARPPETPWATAYWPHITVMEPFSSMLVDAPPSGHMAGIWGRTDASRGVHKAPANELVNGALNVGYRLTRDEQGRLNSNGINGIRLFAREGIRVWGARTLDSPDSEWRYLSVRRLFNMVEESIEEGTNWIVFEPNDPTLWKHVRRDIGAFLMRVWRDGALMGATPEEAFFVKCDAETNPAEVVGAGQLVAQIGLAPVKPAEFIVFQISQSTAGAEITG